MASKRTWVCLALFLIASFIAYKRYPTYLTTPNFYAEDGSVFAANIVHKGFWSALVTPFNGYFIFGIYLLEGTAFLANGLTGGGDLLNLPVSLAIVSYTFWGLLATFPLMLFWNDIKNKVWLFLVGILLALTPLPSFNYAILGTVGNYKFAFVYIAFLLLVKRLRVKQYTPWIHLLDAGLVICTLTNATVYLLLPIALLAYWEGRRQVFKKNYWIGLFKKPAFLSLGITFLLVGIQIVYIALRGGVDELQGYLQEPYQFGKTIEIFFQRTLLFPLDHSIAKHLNDILVVGATVTLGGCLIRFARKEDRIIALFGLYAALVTTILFVSQRTGVSQFFSHYQTSATDQFFYAQNLILLFTAAFIFVRYAEECKRPAARILLCVGFGLLLMQSAVHNDFGSGVLMNRLTGDLKYAAQQACQQHGGAQILAPLYPVGAQSLTLDRKKYCPEVANYTPQRQPLPVAPYNNNYAPITDASITQTFKSAHDQLSGLSILLSTFGVKSDNKYQLNLYDAHCQKTLRVVDFTGHRLIDNAYFDIHFTSLTNSKNKTYCFKLSTVKLQPDAPAVAVQLSEPQKYLDGAAIKNGNPLDEDVVFDLLYR
jgi:hypothetical protein